MQEIKKYGPHNPLFGRYELSKLLGYGAFAKVYRARDLSSGHCVAVKIINKKKLTGAASVANIKREISIMRRLRHPNIVCLHEVLANKSKIFFVMEFVKGGELFSKIAKGRFTEDLSRKYFQQLISAVGFCHSRGVFHRDLKPENLLVDENDNLKVTDFGLSAVADQIRPDGMLHTLCGTPAYVAPEVLIKKGYDGAKLDVWSCGVVLFVLNAGYLPFNNPNLMAMYKKIYKGEYRCPKWMSPDLKRFLSRLLDTNPQTRITVDEILKDPWFTKGGFEEIKFHDVCSKFDDKDDPKSKTLTAFDIISFSPGLDLSGLFDETHNSVENCERFVSAETPEKIFEKIEETCKKENLRTKKKELAMVVVGGDGNSVIGIELYRLTEGMMMVEVRKRGGDGVFYRELWKNKLRARLVGPLAHPAAEEEASSSQRVVVEDVDQLWAANSNTGKDDIFAADKIFSCS